MVNPYESPQVAIEAEGAGLDSRWRILRVLFCLINLAAAAIVALIGFSGMLEMMNREVGIGAIFSIMMISPFGLYAVLEGFAIFVQPIERGLGYANFACGGLVCFGVVTNVYEGIGRSLGDWTFYAVFLPIMGGIATYLLTCGWIRVRLQTKKARLPKQPGSI